MTAQRLDYLLVDDERRRIAAAAPVPFAPNAFGLRLGDGRFKSREIVKLQKLPNEFTPSSVWVDYGSMLWVLPEPSELENP